jgi:hypothetical protein
LRLHLAGSDALLALLTGEFDDGRQLATTFVCRVEDDGRRRALAEALGRLVGGGEPRRRPRVVILGGLERLGSELGQRLCEGGPFEVRWRACEKKPSSGGVQRGVAAALRSAEAAVIITGMASHMLMQFAKDYARRGGIPWRCVEKATDAQLKAALRDMLPELSAGWEKRCNFDLRWALRCSLFQGGRCHDDSSVGGDGSSTDSASEPRFVRRSQIGGKPSGDRTLHARIMG